MTYKKKSKASRMNLSKITNRENQLGRNWKKLLEISKIINKKMKNFHNW